ncbi:MAG: 5-formyltetrahydrofolate cyclo-ligase [Thermoanaerobaculia bacterium]
MRRKLAAIRDAMPAPERDAASEAVARAVLELPEVAAAGSVFLCLSFGSELDTQRLVERLLDDGRRLYVPRVRRGETEMHVHPFPCHLDQLSFGLVQPAEGESELPSEEVDSTLEVALVAGLGFDRRGYRLGYGAGYFDRFLAGRPFPAIGLAFESQIIDELPVEPHDVPMQLVVTEQRTIAAGARDQGSGRD